MGKIYIRQCPKCGLDIQYNWSSDYYAARKKNTLCQREGCKSTNGRFVKGQETLNKESIETIWKRKYSEDKFNLLSQQLREKHRLNASGSNNNMFGKPSPQGSGNGWSGWYKGWFFRSILELSFMIKVIERFKFKWESGEQQKFKVVYNDYLGVQRNYFPDFVLDNKYVVECKPKRLHNTPLVSCKTSYATAYFNSLNLKYKIIDIPKLSTEEFRQLVNSGKIILTDKYKIKYENTYSNSFSR